MSELLVIGIVALIVIGPKDLPEMFRQLGRLTAKMRAMAREFSRAMEAAANESGVNDVAKDLRAVTDPKSMGLNAVKDAVDKFEKWDPIKNAAKPTQPLKTGGPLVPPPMPPVVTPTPAAAEAAIPAEAAAPAAPAPAIGPATQALYDRKAQREAILREANERIKALKPAPAPAPAAEVAAPAETDGAPAKKPRAPRKKKAAEE